MCVLCQALTTCVRADVGVAGALVAEGHGAEVAGVGLDAQVDPHMAIEVALLHKLLGAVGALVPRSVVDQNVLLKMKKISRSLCLNNTGSD